jgi:hypothetical protein
VDIEARATAELSAEDWAELRACQDLAYGPREVRLAGPLGRVRWAGREEAGLVVRARVEGVLARACMHPDGSRIEFTAVVPEGNADGVAAW